MVTVIGYKVATNKNGEQYIALKIIGPIEMVQSATTGKFIATVRKTVIPATFNEDVAKLMIGSQLEGTIVRVPCDPYEYTNRTTGDVYELAYNYVYQPIDSSQSHSPTEEVTM